MSNDLHSELQSFGDFITQLVANGERSVSPEDALERWRMENLPPEEYDEEVAAIQEALDDMAAGDKGIPLKEAMEQLRQELGLPPRR